jgi:hypothetical protein
VVIVVGVIRDHVIDYIDTEYTNRLNINDAIQEPTEGLS